MENEAEEGIKVSATAIVTRPPDKAVLSGRIKKKGRKNIQMKVREEFSELKKVLLENGVLKKDIETTNYKILKLREEFLNKEYSIEQSFIITVRDVNNVGKVIDLINENSSAEVYKTKFSLDDKTFNDLENDAFKKSAKKLKKRAKAISSGLGLKIDKPIRIVQSIPQSKKKQPQTDNEYKLRKFKVFGKKGSEELETEIKINELSVIVSLTGVFSFR